MRSIVYTEILDNSILGKKIRNDGSDADNTITLVTYIAATTGVFGDITVSGGVLNNVAIGTGVQAGKIISGDEIYVADFVPNTRARLHWGGLDVGDSLGTLRARIVGSGISYFYNLGGVVFGANANTWGSKFEFTGTTHFSDLVTMLGNLTITYDSTSYDLGVLAKSLDLMDGLNADPPSVASGWGRFVTMDGNQIRHLTTLPSTSPYITTTNWDVVKTLNQNVATSSSPTFVGLTLGGTLTGVTTLSCTTVNASSTGSFGGSVQAIAFNAVGGFGIGSDGPITATGATSHIQTDGDVIAGDDVQVGHELQMMDSTVLSAFREAHNYTNPATGLWTGGSVYTVAVETNPVYAMQGTNVSDYDMRTYEVWMSASKPTVETVGSPVICNLSDVLGASISGGMDDYIIVDLDIELKLFSPSLITRMKLQYWLVRAAGAYAYCVDEAFVPAFAAGNQGVYHDSTAPAATNSKASLAIQCSSDAAWNPGFYFYTKAAATEAYRMYVHGTVKHILT